MVKQFAAIRLDSDGIPTEVVGYWTSQKDAHEWASKNWDDYKIVPYWRMGK